METVDLKEIINYFSEHPEKIKDHVNLFPWERVIYGRQFMETHILTLLLYDGNFRFNDPYLERLIIYYNICRYGE